MIFSVAGEGPKANSPIAETLAEAGIPVIYVDFRVHPAENSPASIELIGEAIGRQAQAKEFADYYRAHLANITERVAKLSDGDKPNVFVELLPIVWQTPILPVRAASVSLSLMPAARISRPKLCRVLGDLAV